ncbi:unnamed protein product, partial [Arabidopsis halleri]
ETAKAPALLDLSTRLHEPNVSVNRLNTLSSCDLGFPSICYK